MSSEVTKWDYHALATYITESVAEVWESKFEDGQTAFDRIARRGQEGWELMSVCPIVSNATTRQLLFVFKRPRVVEPALSPAEAPEETSAEEAPAWTGPEAEVSDSSVAEGESQEGI